MTDTFCDTSKRKHSEEDSFECNAKKLRRCVLAAQPDSDSTHSTLGESSMVTRIRNRNQLKNYSNKMEEERRGENEKG